MIAYEISQYFDSPFSTGTKTIGDIVFLVLQGSLALAGVALLVILIGAGIAIIGSAGGKPEDAAKGVKTATSALVGFIIVFAAYIIVQLISKVLTGNNTIITNPQ
jgi:hypothetical protein